MYKQTIDKKNKTITVTVGLGDTFYNERTVTEKELIKRIKKLIRDYNKIQKQDCDFEEWCMAMQYDLRLLEKLL